MSVASERRLRTRVRLEAELREQVQRGEGNARARDISESGVCYAGSPFAPRRDGDEVILRFCLPDDPQPIEVLGTIADERCLARSSETRVEFVWPREADVVRIREFVAARSGGGHARPARLRKR